MDLSVLSQSTNKEMMMQREYASEQDATEVSKSAVYLAWVAAGGPTGFGFLQDKPTADKDAVWENAYGRGDYPGGREIVRLRGLSVNADYVFGRMLKLYIERPTSTTIDVPDEQPTRDYQSWCGKYKTYAALFDAAEKDARVTAKIDA